MRRRAHVWPVSEGGPGGRRDSRPELYAGGWGGVDQSAPPQFIDTDTLLRRRAGFRRSKEAGPNEARSPTDRPQPTKPERSPKAQGDINGCEFCVILVTVRNVPSHKSKATTRITKSMTPTLLRISVTSRMRRRWIRCMGQNLL